MAENVNTVENTKSRASFARLFKYAKYAGGPLSCGIILTVLTVGLDLAVSSMVN